MLRSQWWWFTAEWQRRREWVLVLAYRGRGEGGAAGSWGQRVWWLAVSWAHVGARRLHTAQRAGWRLGGWAGLPDELGALAPKGAELAAGPVRRGRCGAMSASRHEWDAVGGSGKRAWRA